jgi:uncharacterized metal-binding protein
MQGTQEISAQPIEGEKVLIIACAGTDKALGSVTRACAFKVVEKLRPKETMLVCIPPLVAEVKPYSELVKKYPSIIVDGCAERCATKIAIKNGAKMKGRTFLPQSAQKYNLKPNTASDIGPEGEELAEKIAQEIAVQVDRLLGKGS